MPNPLISQITLPVEVEGQLVSTVFDIKDTAARQMIEDLGNALYWMGITTTELTDGATTNPVTIEGESVTAEIGGMVSYEGLEFVWNGSAWQAMGHANFGALAFKSSASGSYTPAGSVSVTPAQAADTTASVVPFGAANVPTAFSVANEVLTIVPGTAATAGTAVDVVTASGAVTATAAFVGTAATITVE
jgi:hypothetical protein